MCDHRHMAPGPIADTFDFLMLVRCQPPVVLRLNNKLDIVQLSLFSYLFNIYVDIYKC